MPAPIHLVADSRIDAGAAGPLLAWCPQTNLLALQGAAGPPDAQQICLLDPAEPQAYTAASVPLDAAKGERLLALDWAPCGTEAQLLAATSAGAVHIWAQQPAGQAAEQPTSLDAWHCCRVFDAAVPPLRVRWLHGPPAWHWADAKPEQPGAEEAAELRFQPGARLSSAWLRPSLACFIAVAPDTSFQVVWRELGQCWMASRAAPQDWPQPLAGADAAVGSDGALWLLGWQAQATSLALCCFQGDPTACSTNGGAGLRPAGSQQLRLDAGRIVLTAALDPGAGGLVVAAAGADGVCLLSYAIHAGKGGPSFSLRGAIANGTHDAPLTLCQTEAGCLACAGGESLILLSPGALQAREVHLPAAATAAALSGNGEALAAVAADGSVQFFLVDAKAAPTHLARRLAWSVLRGSSAWDVLAALRAAQPMGLQAALAAADAMAHSQPPAVRSALCAALSRAKLQLLPELPDATAAAVAQDCWARCLLDASEPVLAAVHAAAEEHKQRQQCAGGGGGSSSSSSGPSLGAADRMAVSGWASWADSYAALLLQAARLWAARRAAAEGQGPEAAAAADAVPCVRLLADTSFLALLRQALMLQVLLKRSGSNREAGLKEAGLARALAGALDALQAAACPPGPAAGAEGEAGGGCQAAAHAAQQSFQGPFSLHYCQPGGRVDWRGVTAALEQPPLAALAKLLPAPEEGSLGRLALRLGLLHERQPPPPDSAPPPGLQPLALPPEVAWLWAGSGGGSGGVRGVKRRRWQRERDAAFGLDGRPTAGRAPLDCVTGHSLGWSRQLAFVTAGGLSATADLTGDLYAREAGRSELQDLRRAWYNACPVTGLPWKRAAE